MKVSIFNFALFGINTYLIYDEATGEAAVIDPGMISDEERHALVQCIERRSLRVTHLINTHLHIDHVAGNRFVMDKYKVVVEAHAADEPLGKRMDLQADMFHLPFTPDGAEISLYLKEGDEIHLGAGVLKVIHVPGHSPGSIALYSPQDRFIITGDILFQGSVGRTDLPGGSHAQLIEGITGKLLTLPPDTVVYPGHGPATTIGEEKKHNPFLTQGNQAKRHI